jgi:hypothetical protein
MNKIGQIVPNKFEVSKIITSLTSRIDVKDIVEIGTWNGMGSTRCVLQGLENKKEYNFKSYECWEEMYQEAIINNKDFLGEKFSILNGKIVDEKTITDWFNVEDLTEEQKKWLQQDIDRMSKIENMLYSVPEKIDLLILDGGEFSTYKEWHLLKNKVKYAVFDDTTALKCKRIRSEIIENKEFLVLADNLKERNGFLVIERKT